MYILLYTRHLSRVSENTSTTQTFLSTVWGNERIPVSTNKYLELPGSQDLLWHFSWLQSRPTKPFIVSAKTWISHYMQVYQKIRWSMNIIVSWKLVGKVRLALTRCTIHMCGSAGVRETLHPHTLNIRQHFSSDYFYISDISTILHNVGDPGSINRCCRPCRWPVFSKLLSWINDDLSDYYPGYYRIHEFERLGETTWQK